MISSLPLIVGIASIFVGCFLFFVSSGVYKQKKTDNAQEKPKILKLLMRIVSLFLMIIGGYSLFNLDSNIHIIESAKLKTDWSETAKDSLKNYCLFGMGKQPKEYLKINFDYCDCTSEKIMKVYTQAEYEEIIKKPFDQQFEIFSELTKDCLPELQRRYDSIAEVKSSKVKKKLQ